MNKEQAQRQLTYANPFRLKLAGPNGERFSDELEPHYKELQDALVWFIDNGDTEAAKTLSSALWRFWMDKGHVEEGRKLVKKILNQPGKTPPSKIDAEFLFGAGMLAFRQGDNKEAERSFLETLSISRKQNNKIETVKALTGLARTALRENNYAKVRARGDEARALARDIGDNFLESRPLHMLAAAAKMEGDFQNARKLYEESLALSRKLGDDAMVSVELDNLGSVALHTGDLGTARDSYRQAAEIAYKQRNNYILPYVPLHFNMIALEEGKTDRAVKLLGASEALFESSGMSPDPDETVERDRTIATLRKKVSEPNFNKLWAEGKKLTLDQTVSYSLEK